LADPPAPAAPSDPSASPDVAARAGVVETGNASAATATTRTRLRRLFGYALPHRALVFLALALMGLQALAASSRILLALPVLTRVLEMHVADDPSSATRPAGGKPLRLPRVVRALDGTLDGLNRMTASWVPERALDPGTGTTEGTPEGRAAARARLLDRYATLLSVLILFLAFIAATTLLAYFGDYVDERLRLRILMDVRRDVCARLLAQPMRFYDGAHRGDVVQRVLDDVNGVSSALKMLLASMPEGVLTLGAGLLVLAALSVELTAVCVVGLLLFLPLRRFTKRVKRLARKRQGATARRAEVLLQTVSGIRTVKAFRAEDRKVAEFVAADREVFRESLDVQRTKSASDAATELVNNFLAMALTVGGGWLLLREALPIGAPILAVFLMQVGGIHRPAKRLVKDLNSMNDALASVDRVFEILDLPGPPPDPAGAPAFPGLADRIRFEHVGFAYRPGHPVLADVSFELRRGTTVALVGPSGAGKSTLCDLLLRLYEPTEGRITVDGAPLASFRRASWLDRTAVVTQEPFLFHASIGANLGLGRQGATGAEIRAAAEAAQIHGYVVSLPEGYDAEVGERGARLSGGQRQRITIARALLRDPLVLVLDEATASLDAESEREVQDAIERLRAGRTTLVVAHRLATVKRADAIVVVDEGRVVDQGTHDELLARGGLYARLCAMQDLGATPPAGAAAVDADASNASARA
jgi:ABC-type multidrug transport system fused ATPase/permease subunit